MGGRMKRKLLTIFSTVLILATATVSSASASLGDIPITGTVKDKAGAPLVGVLVSDGTHWDETDTLGQFEVQRAVGQSFVLTASRTGLVALSKSATALPGTTVTFELFYSINSSLSPGVFFNGPPKVMTLSLSSYAPSSSCLRWRDLDSGAVLQLQLANPIPGGASAWAGSFPVPGITPDGTHLTEAWAETCNSSIRLSPVVQSPYTTDSVPASIDISSISPPDGANTVFSAQPLLARVSDDRSGVNPASISFKLIDESSSPTQVVSYSATVSAGWARTAPVTLVSGHSYKIEIIAADRAGNATVASQRDGFSLFPVTPSSGLAQITETVCSVGEINLQTQSRPVSCPNVPLTFSDTSVHLSGTRHGPGKAFVEHRVLLGGAKLTTSIAGVQQSQSAYPSGTSKTESLAFDVPDAGNTASDQSVQGRVLNLGTLTTTVPATWSSASLSMLQTATTPSLPACADPSVSSTSCTTDPLDTSFDVQVSPSGSSVSQISNGQASRYGLVVNSVSEASRTYSAWTPLGSVSSLSSDSEVAGVTRTALRSGASHVPHHVLPLSNEIGFDVAVQGLCPSCDERTLSVHYSAARGGDSMVQQDFEGSRASVFLLPGDTSFPTFTYWLEVNQSCSNGSCAPTATRFPAVSGSYVVSLKDLELETVAKELGVSQEMAKKAIDLTPAVDDLRLRAASIYPDTFAGLWRDYTSNGGRVQVAFTDDAQAKATTLAALFADPGFVDGVSATFTEAELSSLADQITSDLPALKSQGVNVRTVEFDVIRNRVTVVVPDGDEYSRSYLETHYDASRLYVEYGDPVQLTQDEDPGCERLACGPKYLRAGLDIFFPRDGDLWICSTAFTASRGGNGGPRGIFTAGHCQTVGGHIGHGAAVLGTVAYGKFSGNTDGEWIDVVDHWTPSANWIWEEVWSKKYTITSRVGSSGGAVGDPTCHSGETEGYRCGKILSTSITVNVDGTTLTDQKKDNVCSRPGDSGGPIYNNHVAQGVISAGNFVKLGGGYSRCADAPATYYSGIYNIEQSTGTITQTWPRSCFSGTYYDLQCPPGT